MKAGKPSSSPRLPRGTVPALGLALTGLVAAVGLAALATPSDFDARLAAVERDTEVARRQLRQRAPADALPIDGACRAASAREIAALRTALGRTAETFRLQSVTVEVEPDPAADSARLTALRIRMDASGPYDAALGALQHLSTVRPMVFVDQVDLASKTSFVTLSVRGHAFCSAD